MDSTTMGGNTTIVTSATTFSEHGISESTLMTREADIIRNTETTYVKDTTTETTEGNNARETSRYNKLLNFNNIINISRRSRHPITSSYKDINRYLANKTHVLLTTKISELPHTKISRQSPLSIFTIRDEKKVNL